MNTWHGEDLIVTVYQGRYIIGIRTGEPPGFRPVMVFGDRKTFESFVNLCATFLKTGQELSMKVIQDIEQILKEWDAD